MKWLLAVPHYVVLVVLWFVAIVAVVIAWFAILFTGRYRGVCSTSWWGRTVEPARERVRVPAGDRSLPRRSVFGELKQLAGCDL